MFLQLSIILFTGGGCLQTPPRQIPAPEDGHCNGRYPSYWNAFLFKLTLPILDLQWTKLHLVRVQFNTCQFHIDLRLQKRFYAPIMLCTWRHTYCAEMSCTSFSCSHSVWVISSVYVGAVEAPSISGRNEVFTSWKYENGLQNVSICMVSIRIVIVEKIIYLPLGFSSDSLSELSEELSDEFELLSDSELGLTAAKKAKW